MKIGRNDLCPCSSGKKYKKCCIDKILVDKTSEVCISKQLFQSGYFPMVEEKAIDIRNVLSEYNFNDLAVAIYCINLSLNNRSALENSLALNAALLLQENFGEKHISNYDEFAEFFQRVEKRLPTSIMDDYTIDDFGEVKFTWDERVYDVIIGTGHNQVFGLLQFLPELAKMEKKESELKELLEYSSGVIAYFKKENISNGDEEIKYLLPSKELFYRTKGFFNNEIKRYSLENISNIFNNSDIPIEKCHFVIKYEQLYPLYNTSILVDAYSIWIKNLSDDKQRSLVNISIMKVLGELCKMDDKENPKVLFPASILKDGKFLSKYPYAFCAATNNGIILAINEDIYSENELQDEIKKIKSLHKNNCLDIVEVISANKDKTVIGLSVPSDENISIILFNNFTNITEGSMILKKKSEKYLTCSALDMMYILSFMDDFEELDLYLNQQRDNEYEKIIAFGGEATKFLAWKQQNHMFSKGAIKFGMISLSHDIDTSYVLDYYKSKLQEYPWGIDEFMFSYPFSWNIEEKESDYYLYINKLSKGFGGILKRFENNCTLFFTHNIEFHNTEERNRNEFETISFVDDLNDRKIKRCENIFKNSTILHNTCIQILYMPFSYAKKVDNTGFTKDTSRKYVYSDIQTYKNNICIRYAVNNEKLYNDIHNAEDRTIENEYFKELFKPLEEVSKEDYYALVVFLDKEIKLKKEVDVCLMEIDYYWSDKVVFNTIDDKAYLDVRKKIAKLCCDMEIKPGIYNGRQATGAIRTMQGALISIFENDVAKFNRDDLHCQALSVYSNLIHLVNINKNRYGSYHNVEEEIIEEIHENIVNRREEDKHNIRCVQYLLETNLNLHRISSKKCSADEVEFLMAFANWLVVLQDSADLCYNSDKDLYIEISTEYIVDVIAEDEVELLKEETEKRIYNNRDYTIKGDEQDTSFIDATISAFKKDTDLDFLDMLSFIEYMQLSFSEDEYIEIAPNVIEMEEDEIIQGFQKCLQGNIEKENVIKIIEMLTIDTEKLKLWRGEIRSFLPINERELRDNRYDVKPLVKNNSKITFSPIVLKELRSRWKYGTTDFYLPYEIGLDNVVKILESWKKRYEDLMVYDIVDIFRKSGFKHIWHNAKLHSLDKLHKHPQKLGDYDVLVIDDNSAEIWIIESKVLSKVGSIHEMYMQQANFFLNHKYDEKFQRRIDYMNQHYKELLETLGFDHYKEYKIKPYMVTNKILISRYKKIEYPIISIYELKQYLDNNLKY